MVYKKYIKRGGKSYGPYYYESVRENGKVINRYVSKVKEGVIQPENEANNFSFFKSRAFAFIGVILLLAIFIYALNSFNVINITGKATLENKMTFIEGEKLDGKMDLILFSGEFIPADSIVILHLGNLTKEMKLSELVNAAQTEGTFFAQGVNLEGEGQGYGTKGAKITYPKVDFELRISTNIQTKAPSETPNETPTETPAETPTETPAETPAGTPSETPPETPAETPTETPPETPSETPPETPSETTSGGFGGITGGAIMGDEFVVPGSASKGDDFAYTLEEGQGAEIVFGSVKSNSEAIGDDKVDLRVSGNKLEVSTDYDISEEGFGADYLGVKAGVLEIDLSKFDAIAEAGDLEMKVVYNGEEIVSTGREIDVIAGAENISENNLSFLKEIPAIRIPKNGNYTINLSEYFSGAERYYITLSNISASFEGELMNLVPEEGFSGARRGNIIAYSGEESIESNEFNILVSNNEMKIDTLHGQIKLGERVKWTKNVSLEVPEGVAIELPASAEEVVVNKINERGEKEEASNLRTNFITGEAILGSTSSNIEDTQGELITVEESKIGKWLSGFFNNIFNSIRVKGTITGRVSEEINGTAVIDKENHTSLEVMLDANVTNYIVEYSTEAPTSTEQETANGKIVTISGPDDVEYTDVLSYTNVSELVSVEQKDKIKIHWVENNSYVPFDAYDLDGNGKIDYIEWVTPHLSNQTFEIILITKAEHLDENRTLIEDVYEQVKERDGNWTSEIPAGHYIRVTFEQNLTSDKDITLYARSNYSDANIEVYEIDGGEKIADFGGIGADKEYKIYLTNLAGSQDTFDLKIAGNPVEFDYIVDPATGTPSANPAFFISSDGGMASDAGSASDDFNEVPIQLNDYGQTTEKCTAWDCTAWTEAATADFGYYCSEGWNCSSWNGVSCSQYKCLAWTKQTNDRRAEYCSGGFNCSLWNGNYCNRWNCLTYTESAADGYDEYCSGGWGCNSWNGANCNLWNCTEWADGSALAKADFYCSSDWSCTSWNGNICANWNCSSWGNGTAKFDVYCKGIWNCTSWNGNICSGWGCTLMNTTGTTAKDNYCDNWNCSYWDATKKVCQGWQCLDWKVGATTDKFNHCSGVYNCTTWTTGLSYNSVATHTTPILSSTSGTNTTTENLTCYNQSTADADGDSVKNIYNWNKNGISLPVLNMPFEGGSNSTWTRDYALGNNGTVNSSIWNGTDGYDGRGAYVFNVVGDGIAGSAIPEVSVNSNFTICFRVKPGAGQPATTTNPIFTNWNSLTDKVNCHLSPTTKNMTCNVYNGTTSFATASSNSPFAANTWYHSCYIKNGTSGQLIVNGVLQTGITGSATGSGASFGYYTIGSQQVGSTRWFNGTIDDLAVYRTSLSTQQISALYNNLTNTIVSQELAVGQNWSCAVTPNDGFADGSTLASNSLTILAFDPNYPKFSNYWDNDATLVGSGLGKFNVTLTNTNGTVWLEINNTNITARNLTANVYNVSYAFTSNGTYSYKWWAYGNGTNKNINNSGIRYYTVNATTDTTAPTINFTNPSEASGTTLTRNNIVVNVTASDSGSGLKNITVRLYNSTSLVNTTTSTGSPLYLNFTSLTNGLYFFNASAYDNAGNSNATGTRNVTINYDISSPLVAITYPANTTYAINVSALNYTYSDANPGSCWYSRDSGATNSSAVAAGTNFTGITSVEGSNTWRVYCNDTLGNLNYSDVTFAKDTIIPVLTVYSPANTTYDNRTILVNFTADSYQALWFYNGTANVSYSTPVLVTFAEGSNTLIAYANNSAGLLNSTSVIFSINSVYPTITINTPANTTYNNRTQLVNISTTGASSTWFNNGTANVSYSTPVLVTFAEGSNTLIAYSNNSAGLLNQTSVIFSINSVYPTITINTPANTTYNNRTQLVNISFSGESSKWFFNGTANVSYSTPVLVTFAEGSNTLIAYANNSAGLLNSTSVTFFVDSIKPLIGFVSPTPINNSYLSQSNIPVNISVSDTNLDKVVLRLYNSTSLVNTTISSLSNLFVNFTNLADGIYYFNATANDTLGNENLTSTRKITLDTAKPGISIVYPENITYGVTVSELNYSVSDTNLQACWYSIDSGATNTTTACGTNITALTSNEGSNTWEVWANDSAGNVNVSSVTFIVDLSTPGIYLVTPTENSGSYTNTGHIDVNVTASNLLITNVTINLYNATGFVNSTMTNETGGMVHLGIKFVNLTDGIYFFNATAEDAFGRANSTETRNVTIDTVNPLISLVSPTELSGASVNKDNILINASASDINLASITIQIYNSSYGQIYSYSTSSPNSSLFVNQSGLADGMYYFNATALDKAGNANYTETRNITLETQAPLITLNSPQNTTYNTNVITFNATLNENGTCRYSLDGAGNITMSSSNNREFVDVNSSMSEGSHSAIFSCNDSAGNVNSSSVTFGVDTVAPLISISSPLAQNYNNRTQLVDISAIGESSVWFFNGTENVSYTTPVNVTFAEGSNTLIAYANDSIGNLNSTSVSFTIDTSAPSLTGFVPASGSEFNYSKMIEIASDASDSSGVDSALANVSLPNSSTQLIPLLRVGATDKYNASFTTPELLGQYNITFIVNDSLGNVNNGEKTSFVVVDRIIPVVNLFNPGNGVQYTTNREDKLQTVYFQYNVSEFDIANCSLIVNNAAVSSSSNVNMSIGAVNEFVKDFASGSYAWSIRCTDDSSNIGTSENRSFSVVVPVTTTPSGGGGGGGGGATEIIPTIQLSPEQNISGGEEISTSQKELIVSAVIGEKAEREVKIKNPRNEPVDLVIEVEGEIKDILKIDKTMHLEPNEEATLNFEIESPHNSLITGKILLIENGVVIKEIQVAVNIKSENFLFDSALTVSEDSKVIEPGENLIIQINLLQVGPKEKVDVVAHYVIKDYAGKIYLEESETFFVLNAKDYVREFSVSNLPPGKYSVGLELSYPGAFAVSSAQFEVAPKAAAKLSVQTAVVAVIIIAIAALFAWWALRRKKLIYKIKGKRKV